MTLLRASVRASLIQFTCETLEDLGHVGNYLADAVHAGEESDNLPLLAEERAADCGGRSSKQGL